MCSMPWGRLYQKGLNSLPGSKSNITSADHVTAPAHPAFTAMGKTSTLDEGEAARIKGFLNFGVESNSKFEGEFGGND